MSLRSPISTFISASDASLRSPISTFISASDIGSSTDIGPASSGVVHLRLEPIEVRADDGVQLGLWGGRTQADEWARRAATRLAGLVGDERVVVAEWRGGRQPADLYRFVPASLSSAFEAGQATIGAAPATSMPWPGRLPAPSPAVVYSDPQRIDVVDANGAVVAVSGRGAISASPVALRGAPGMSTVAIAAWAGPWLLEERWWDAANHRRLARFQLLSADGRAILATIEQRQWWLVAEYA
jgi:protein ImuB